LIGEAVEGNDYNRRGWAIACLADIGSKEAVQSLTRIMDDSDTPDLVKMWSGAALTRIRGVDAIKDLMLAAAKDPSRKQALAGLLLGMRAGAVRPLTTIMLTGETNQERQQATAWLGTLDQRLRGGIVRKVLNDALAYSAGQAKEGVPWAGGALYLPRSAWTTREAWDMTRNLLCWLVWSEEHGKKDIATQLQNNLRDLSWRNGVGFRQGGSGRDWARALLKKRALDTSAINDQTPYQAVILIVQLLSFSA
jgi:HEAT repeat protein